MHRKSGWPPNGRKGHDGAGRVQANWNPRAAGQARVLLQTNLLISSFGQDEAGELYVLDLRGGVFMMVAAD